MSFFATDGNRGAPRRNKECNLADRLGAFDSYYGLSAPYLRLIFRLGGNYEKSWYYYGQ